MQMEINNGIKVVNYIVKMDSDVGYSQGMNFVAAFLLTKMPEEQAFWMFQTLMTHPRFNLRNFYNDDIVGLLVSKYQVG